MNDFNYLAKIVRPASHIFKDIDIAGRMYIDLFDEINERFPEDFPKLLAAYKRMPEDEYKESRKQSFLIFNDFTEMMKDEDMLPFFILSGKTPTSVSSASENADVKKSSSTTSGQSGTKSKTKKDTDTM